jgi:hypothetical protein
MASYAAEINEPADDCVLYCYVGSVFYIYIFRKFSLFVLHLETFLFFILFGAVFFRARRSAAE